MTPIWTSASLAVFLSISGAIVHARSFSYDGFGGTFINYLIDISHDTSRKDLLNKIVNLTCDGPGWIFLGVNYSFINENSANFYVGKKGKRACLYANLSENDVDQAIDHALKYLPRYIVTIPINRQLTNDQGHAPDYVNMISQPLAERLAGDQRFVRDPRSDDSVTIYRVIVR
jgi:hypothetical protein